MWEEDRRCSPRPSPRLGLGAAGVSWVQPSHLLGLDPAHLCSPCFFSGLIPHLLGDVVFLWGCNLLAHFINAYLVDDSVSDTPGGLGRDQNPGSQVGLNKGLPFFLCADAPGLGQAGTWGFS